MTTPHKLTASLVRASAIAAALLAVTILTMSESRAAFSDTTDNTGNSFSTNTVVLADDDAGSALFTASGMTPGTPVVECIEVTYSGTETPVDVRMYGSSTGTLDAYLDTTIEIGTGGGTGDCASFTPTSTIFGSPSGTLATFASSHTNYTDGLTTFTASANPTSRVFRITIEVQDNDAAQGLASSASFVWEAQSG